jgi:hypothetical protein
MRTIHSRESYCWIRAPEWSELAQATYALLEDLRQLATQCVILAYLN